MKLIALLLIIGFGTCNVVHYFHHNGTMTANGNPGIIFGVTIVEFLKTINMTYIEGMYVVNKVHTPFELVSKFVGFETKPDGSFKINMTYLSGRFGATKLNKVEGWATLIGTWDKAEYNGHATSKHDSFVFDVKSTAKKYPCEFYPMKEAAIRAG